MHAPSSAFSEGEKKHARFDGVNRARIHVVDNNTLNPHRWGCLRPGSMWGRWLRVPCLLLRCCCVLCCHYTVCSLESNALGDATWAQAQRSKSSRMGSPRSRSCARRCARARVHGCSCAHARHLHGSPKCSTLVEMVVGGIGCSGSGALARRPARRWEDLVHADPLAGSPSPFALIRCAVAPLTTV